MSYPPKVTCVMCTYGRFSMVRESLRYFLLQDYPAKELIIFNNHPRPIFVSAIIRDLVFGEQVLVVNNPGPFRDLADVREAACGFVDTDYMALWDDDDIYLPWHLSQAMACLVLDRSLLAFKPEISLITSDGGESYTLGSNVMEASIVMQTSVVHDYGFKSGYSFECEPIINALQASGKYATEKVRPSYAYCWGNGVHHISGNEHPENFAEHREIECDTGQGKALTPGNGFIEQYTSIAKALRQNGYDLDELDY